MIKDLRLVTNAELRAQQPQGNTPEYDANSGDQGNVTRTIKQKQPLPLKLPTTEL